MSYIGVFPGLSRSSDTVVLTSVIRAACPKHWAEDAGHIVIAGQIHPVQGRIDWHGQASGLDWPP